MTGLITRVEPRSAAAQAGLWPGDELVSINDLFPRDVIDVQFYGAEEELTFRVRRDDVEFTAVVRRGYAQPLGLSFARPTFDTDIRRCDNRCDFCFVAQMPPGLRPSLYVRDDDYRHSFLFGNYVTLTNLTEADWKRITAQHLSPLYVSVHATEPALRRRMLRNPHAPDVLDQLRRLSGLGIEVHTQLVLVPQVNDGSHLERSIDDLAGLYPAVRTVSVVPVGLTRFHRGGCRPYTDDEMQQVVRQVTTHQQCLLGTLGVRFTYLSDEWYLRLDLDLPPIAAYDDLDLTENGIGLTHQFLQSANLQSANLQSATLVTGTLFAPTLRRVTEGYAAVDVAAVVNEFFGATVTVAGLLTAGDVIEQLRERPLGDVVALPATMFAGPNGRSLDGLLPGDVALALGRPVVTARDLADLHAGFRQSRMAPTRHEWHE